MKSVNYSAYIGLDVHKDTIAVAVANPERQGEVRFYGNISSAKDSVIRRLCCLNRKATICSLPNPRRLGVRGFYGLKMFEKRFKRYKH